MGQIEMEMKPPVKSIQEFVNRVTLPKSIFKYNPAGHNKFDVRIKHSELIIPTNLFLHSGGFSNLVKGEIDESVIENKDPRITLKPSIVYRIYQGVLLLLVLFFVYNLIIDFDLTFALMSTGIFLSFYLLLFGMYKFGERIFSDAYAKEMNNYKS